MVLKQNNFWTNYFKDWRTYYKILAVLLITASLVYSFVIEIVNIADATIILDDGSEIDSWAIQTLNQNGEWETHYDYSGEIIFYFSYFTTQSNILVLVWWIIVLFYPWLEGKKGLVSTKGTIYVITYISVTMIIYCGLLLPNFITSDEEVAAGYWFTSVVLHLVSPIATIVYALFFMNKYHFYTLKKEWLTKQAWWILIYPLCYGIFILIRGEIRHASGHIDQLSYPYFFFYLRTKTWGLSGAIWCPIVVLLIFCLLILFSILYVVVFSKFQNKKLTINFTNSYQKKAIKTKKKVSNS